MGWLSKGNSLHPETPLPGESGSHPQCKPLEGDMTPTLGGARRETGSSSPVGPSGRSAVEGCARSQLDMWYLKTSWRSDGQCWSHLRVATKAAEGARSFAHPTLRWSKHRGRHKRMGGEGWEEEQFRASLGMGRLLGNYGCSSLWYASFSTKCMMVPFISLFMMIVISKFEWRKIILKCHKKEQDWIISVFAWMIKYHQFKKINYMED